MRRERVKLKKRPPEPIFGAPPLIEGEDAATYEELLAGIHAAVQPVDMIEEMLVDDVISLEWELLRWRRLKTSLMRARGLEALERFLCGHLDYNTYLETAVHRLADILQKSVPQEQAKILAHDCAWNKPEAVERVNRILGSTGRHLDPILNDAKANRAQQLVQEYVQRDPDAVTLVNGLLEGVGMSVDTLVADALAENLEYVERIDRLTTIAEGRRNASLREIDRRRVLLGETLRQALREVEARHHKLLEPPAKGEAA
jgi:hypothetical protein